MIQTIEHISTDVPRIAQIPRLSSGAALFMLEADPSVWLTKAVFYVLGGMGFELRLVGALGLAAEISYVAFFEETFPITGFSPSLQLRLAL